MIGDRGGEADQKWLPKRVIGGVFHSGFSEKWQRRMNHGEMCSKSMVNEAWNGRIQKNTAGFGKSMMKCLEKAW